MACNLPHLQDSWKSTFSHHWLPSWSWAVFQLHDGRMGQLFIFSVNPPSSQEEKGIAETYRGFTGLADNLERQKCLGNNNFGFHF